MKKTRQAITAVKEAIKTQDNRRIRQATERLREAAIRLRGAVHRRAPAATDEEHTSGAPDVVDAEFEETDNSDRKAG